MRELKSVGVSTAKQTPPGGALGSTAVPVKLATTSSAAGVAALLVGVLVLVFQVPSASCVCVPPSTKPSRNRRFVFAKSLRRTRKARVAVAAALVTLLPDTSPQVIFDSPAVDDPEIKLMPATPVGSAVIWLFVMVTSTRAFWKRDCASTVVSSVPLT